MTNPYDDAIAAARPLRPVASARYAPELAPKTAFASMGAAEGLWSPLDPISYDVAGIIPTASLGLIAGYSSSLKSWAGFDLALSVASGLPWFGHGPFATEAGPVTIMEREGGPYESRRRLHALRRGREAMPDPKLDLCCYSLGTIFDRSFVAALTDLAKARRLILIDTLAAFATGVDENTAGMADGLLNLARVAHETKCTIAVVAHEKKRGKDGGDIDPRERVRGSSSIFGSVDWVLSMQRDAPRSPVEVVQTKARNGREADPFTLAMLDGPDGSIAWKVTVEDAGVPKAASKYDRIRTDILEVVRANPGCVRGRIESDVTGRAVAIRTALDELVTDGSIARFGDEGRHTYRLGRST